MIYMIAHFEAENTTMDLMKKGNMYQIWMKDGDSATAKEFDTIDKAIARFNELSGYMMRGIFSNETRKKILVA